MDCEFDKINEFLSQRFNINTSTTEQDVIRLMHRVAVKDSDTPSYVLESISNMNRDEGLCQFLVIQHRNAPENILRECAKAERSFMRLCVAKNPNTPMDVLRDLVNDPEFDVRVVAIDNLDSHNEHPTSLNS